MHTAVAGPYQRQRGVRKVCAVGLAAVCCLADQYGFVAPTVVTYNTVISACAKGGMWAEARQLADSMAAEGIAKDAFTLSALVRTMPWWLL